MTRNVEFYRHEVSFKLGKELSPTGNSMDWEFEAFTREILTAEERLTFRTALEVLPTALSPSNEDAVLFALLPAELILRTGSIPCLWAVTSKAVMGFEANPGTKVHIIDGPRILLCRPQQGACQLHVSAVLDEKDPVDTVESVLQYQPERQDLATLMSSLINGLALGDMWGQPEKFQQWIATTMRKMG